MVKTSPSNAGGTGLIPGQGAKIPHASQPKNRNTKQKQYCNKFNKDFKNGPHQKKKIFIKNLFSKSVSLFLFCKSVHLYHLYVESKKMIQLYHVYVHKSTTSQDTE